MTDEQPTWVGTADTEDRLDRFLAAAFPSMSRAKVQEWIAVGRPRVDGKLAKAGRKLHVGAVVEVFGPPPTPDAPNIAPVAIPLNVLYEDEYLLVVDKPRGLATHPARSLKAPSLVNALLARGQPLSEGSGGFRPGIVHRLDKDTSGLIVVAKDDGSHHSLARQFERKTAERRYLAVLSGDLSRDRLLVDAPIGRDPRDRRKMAATSQGKPARTHFKRVRLTEKGVLVGARLETGRTHQIRVHALLAGHGVVGDPLYGDRGGFVGPMQLHAAFLSFDHPQSGRRATFTAMPPPDFEADEKDLSLLDPF